VPLDGVPLSLGTSSHDSKTIGRYDYCARVVRELREPTGAATG